MNPYLTGQLIGSLVGYFIIRYFVFFLWKKLNKTQPRESAFESFVGNIIALGICTSLMSLDTANGDAIYFYLLPFIGFAVYDYKKAAVKKLSFDIPSTKGARLRQVIYYLFMLLALISIISPLFGAYGGEALAFAVILWGIARISRYIISAN
jgi:hypothetical protein